MSGHNKFSQIKHQKASEDGKRSKLFSILGRQISVQSKLANGDVNSANLRAIIEKARKANMPNDSINRAVVKGVGSGEATLEEVVYECFGPGGVAIIIQGITDSKNRTSQEIKHILSENGVALGTPGSGAWAFTPSLASDGVYTFTPKNLISISPEDQTKLEALTTALSDHDDVNKVTTNAEWLYWGLIRGMGNGCLIFDKFGIWLCYE